MSLKLYLVSFGFRTGGNYASLKEHMRTLQAQQVLDRQWGPAGEGKRRPTEGASARIRRSRRWHHGGGGRRGMSQSAGDGGFEGALACGHSGRTINAGTCGARFRARARFQFDSANQRTCPAVLCSVK
jgi:hypothetical protein